MSLMPHTIFGVQIDDLAESELMKKLEYWLAGEQTHTIATPNAEFLLDAKTNQSFLNLLNQSDLAMADSVSLQYASAALSESRLVNRWPGVDLLDRLCELAAHKNARVLLLGGEPGSAQGTARNLRQRHDMLQVKAIDPGTILWGGSILQISSELIDRIEELEPDVVAVGLGQYKQEQFIAQARISLPNVKIWIGVGGAFEMISGQRKRAPRYISRIGLEWLWRLFIQPSRWRRIANASIIFPLLVASESIRRKHFIKSIKQVSSEIVRQFNL
jgi:N-acetylglucosaminyldiphosphoundecaprenol N-acetyl-beta-D-mannosaminyltransferase